MSNGFKPTDHRVIRWFFQEYPDLKPQMAAYPYVAYKENGKQVEKHITYIRYMYKNRKVAKRGA